MGATAVMVASARAAETASEQPLIRDEFAQMLIDGPELAQLVAKMSTTYTADPELAAVRAHMVNYQAARTHFFDAYFRAAAAAGIRQVVILAPGWTHGPIGWTGRPGPACTKSTSRKCWSTKPRRWRPTASSRLSSVTRWRPTCGSTGRKRCATRDFDPAQRTAWLAEGLLMFLPGEAEDRLFTDIDALSAPGSRACIEDFTFDEAAREAYERRRAKTDELRQRLGDENVFDPGDLWYTEDERCDPAAWFDTHSWQRRIGDRPRLPDPGRSSAAGRTQHGRDLPGCFHLRRKAVSTRGLRDLRAPVAQPAG